MNISTCEHVNRSYMRLFIAVNIPAEIKDKIEDIQRSLKRSGADVKWVEKDNLHLTLKFIGDVPEDKVLLIASELEPKLKGFGSFEIALSGIGLFPGPDFPRIIWLGITDKSGKLRELTSIIEEAALALGFEKELRGFSPHLTIGRVRSRTNVDRLKTSIIQNGKCNTGPFTLTSADIMESVLTSRGPEYKCLNSISV